MSRRLFFGLRPDKETRNAINASYRQQTGFEGRPHHPDDLHMTLVFLGQIEGTLDCYKEAAANVRVPRFTLELDAFDYWQKPAIILMQPSSPPEELQGLVSLLHHNLKDCGFRPEKRKYRPHVTLVRKAKPLSDQTPKQPIEWQVNQFCLYVSSSRPNPPRYQVIDQWSLL